MRGHRYLPHAALADGYRESAESWADLLRDAKRRGMRVPVLAAGDGAPPTRSAGTLRQSQILDGAIGGSQPTAVRRIAARSPGTPSGE